jgi:hypothetical protein
MNPLKNIFFLDPEGRVVSELLSSVTDPGCLPQIPNYFSIPDPGSGSNNSTKRGGGECFCPAIFCSHKYHKNVNKFIFEQVKNFFGQNTKNHNTFNPKICHELSKIWGFGIRDSEKT